MYKPSVRELKNKPNFIKETEDKSQIHTASV